jgi:2-dehydro-3-deoxygluconokinase
VYLLIFTLTFKYALWRQCQQFFEDAMAMKMTRKLLSIGECMVELRNNSIGSYGLGYAGDCFNTAYYFNHLSGPDWRTDFYTAVGTDRLSDRMVEFIAQCGIDTRHILRLKERSVGLYMIELYDTERSFNYWRGLSAAKHMVQEAELRTAIHEADIIYLSGITLAILDEQSRVIILSAIDIALRSGSSVAFDPNIRASLWESPTIMRFWLRELAARSTYVLPSFDDERIAFGDRTPQHTAERYQGYGARHVIVKNGEQPVLLYIDGLSTTVEIEPARTVVDTTSAGDSFNAAYLASLLNGKVPQVAAKFAAATAAKVVGQHGALVSLAETG